MVFSYFISGTGLIFSSTRQLKFLQSSHQAFPPLPSTPEEFISTGVNARPTFFGCNPPKLDSYPLIIYLPNAPPITGNDPVTKYVIWTLFRKHCWWFMQHSYIPTFIFTASFTHIFWSSLLEHYLRIHTTLKFSRLKLGLLFTVCCFWQSTTQRNT